MKKIQRIICIGSILPLLYGLNYGYHSLQVTIKTSQLEDLRIEADKLDKDRSFWPITHRVAGSYVGTSREAPWASKRDSITREWLMKQDKIFELEKDIWDHRRMAVYIF